MLPRKESLELKKKLAIEAAGRWLERNEIRKEPDKLDRVNDAEFKLHQEREQNYIERERIRSKLQVPSRKRTFAERIIGANNLGFAAPSKDAMDIGMSVARIQTIPPSIGIEPEGFATGFMISPNLLITNHHVFPHPDSANNCAANFMYERTPSGLQKGYPFAIDASKFYLSDAALDYAIVYVNPDCLDGGISLRNFNIIPLIGTKGKIVVGQPLSIIQHPGGGPKQYAVSDNNVLDILENDGFIHYSTDTLEGSSGSPGFNKSWEVAVLHHQGVPYVVNGQIMTTSGRPWDEDTMPESEIQWIANEGISISRIVEHVRSTVLQDQAKEKLRLELLELTKDPLLSGPISQKSKEFLQTSSLNNQSDMANSNNLSSQITLNFYGPTTIFIGGQGPNGLGMQVPASPPVPQPVLFAEKKQQVDPDFDSRPGYDSEFLKGFTIAMPDVIPSREKELFTEIGTNKPYVLNYHHYSLVMNKARRLVMWTASNVSYDPDLKSNRARKEFGTESWIPDPRIPEKFQLTDNEFYKPATNIDRGHIVRREDNCWGESEIEIEYANADTYFWTNCTPQHERFNQSRDDGYKGLWGRLENHLQQQLTMIDNRCILFAGPILDFDDPSEDYGYGDVQYPLRYWKIVLVNDEEAGLSAYGFILDQTDVIKKFGLEEAMLDFSNFKAQQVTIDAITQATGVIFDKQLYEADVMLSAPENDGMGKEIKRSFRTTAEIFVKKK
jgi:endonuclease G